MLKFDTQKAVKVGSFVMMLTFSSVIAHFVVKSCEKQGMLTYKNKTEIAISIKDAKKLANEIKKLIR